MKRWWGLEAAGGLFSFRRFMDDPPPDPDGRLVAAFAEVSALAWGTGNSKRYIHADHGYLRVGVQTLFPLRNANIPPVHLAPFAGLGAVLAIGPLAKGRGYAAILFETRVGYRFGLGSAASPLEGLMTEILAGPAVGF